METVGEVLALAAHDAYVLALENPAATAFTLMCGLYGILVAVRHYLRDVEVRTFKNKKVLRYVGGEDEDMNPFLTGGLPWSHPMEIYKTVILLPLVAARIFLLLAIVVLGAVFIVLPAAWGLPKQDITEIRLPEPILGWRRWLITRLQPVMRVILFAFGFHHIKVEGKLDPNVGTVVSNHCSFLDPFILMCFFTPMFVAAAENLNKPLIGQYMRVTQSITLHRSDPRSKEYVSYNITGRTDPKRGGDFLPMMVFPEGTTHSQNTLLQFKDGAFRPGTPVQPVIIKYTRSRFDPAWTIAGDSLPTLMLRCFCQFYNGVSVRFLPLYIPSDAERKSPTLYANNVRETMALEGRMTLTRQWLEDTILFRKALQLGALGCNLLCDDVSDYATKKKLTSLLSEFHKMDTNNDGLLDYNEFITALAPNGNKQDRMAAMSLFSIMDKTGTNVIDFKEFVAGLYLAQDGPNASEEDIKSKIEFVFSVYGLDKITDIGKVSAMKILEEHHPEVLKSTIESKVDDSWSALGRGNEDTITMEEFAKMISTDRDIYLHSLPLAIRNAVGLTNEK
eukprot:CFRG4453T1